MSQQITIDGITGSFPSGYVYNPIGPIPDDVKEIFPKLGGACLLYENDYEPNICLDEVTCGGLVFMTHLLGDHPLASYMHEKMIVRAERLHKLYHAMVEYARDMTKGTIFVSTILETGLVTSDNVGDMIISAVNILMSESGSVTMPRYIPKKYRQLLCYGDKVSGLISIGALFSGALIDKETQRH